MTRNLSSGGTVFNHERSNSMNVTQMLRLAGALAIAASIAPSVAKAAQIKAGLYNADGLQEICLVSDGTWYSPTYANWGGLWTVVNGVGHIFGNYNSGAGNDSLVIKAGGGSWMEWSDDLTYANPLDPITFTKISKKCTDARHVHPRSTGNPAQRQ
jgi:hypothetical protein